MINMTKFKLCVMPFLLCLFADAQEPVLHIPTELQLIAIDGENIDEAAGFILSPSTSYSLTEGKHRVSLKYYDVWPADDELHEIIQSKPFSMEYNFNSNSVYQVEFNIPRSIEEAQAFAKLPSCEITPFADITQGLASSNDNQLEAPDADNAPGLELSSSEIIDEVNQIEEEMSNAVEVSNSPDSANSLDMLHFWWERASDDERERFFHSVE